MTNRNVTKRAREAGFRYPVSITPRAWADCVTWTSADTRAANVVQDPKARLLWLLMQAADACDGALPDEEVRFELKRTPRKGKTDKRVYLMVRANGKGRRRRLTIDLAA